MTKTKDEIIEAWCEDTSYDDNEVEAFAEGARIAWSHRQKEIDEASRWWAERWYKVRQLFAIEKLCSLTELGVKEVPGLAEVRGELDAAAARVMEVKG